MKVNIEKLEKSFGFILKEIVEVAIELNCKTYLVGGVVRDLILDRPIYDLDIVVEADAVKFAEAFAFRFSKKPKIHHMFKTASVDFGDKRVDFATARKEIYPSYGQLPKVWPAKLEEDLLRRDFTINALAISLNKSNYGELIDICGGMDDLKKGLIRVLHNKSFLEDPTRILRAIRFEQRFSFKIEKNTLKLLKEAVKVDALKWVHPHRLRDELILIFKENNPKKPVKRILSLVGFSFIDKSIKLQNKDLKLFDRIDKSILFYENNFNLRKLSIWIIYLGILFYRLSVPKVKRIVEKFDFKKGQRIILTSISQNLKKVKRLDNNLKPHIIYKVLNSLSFETILFFYAYFYDKKLICKNIEYFFKNLATVRLNVGGADLKSMNIKPTSLYSKILTKLLYAKMDKNLVSKKDELDYLQKIIDRLKRF